ncbi:MAG: flavin-dependent oxidoreductase, partial [Alphaproteobacteria bacterium]|nr:flavin-dependent oxidoreductase [Alphaproteobacteria bacterium]
ANRAATSRSWDLVARYVIPEINGMLDAYRESRQFVVENREVFERARDAIMDKIMSNDKAAAALKLGSDAKPAMSAHYAPDLNKGTGD